jgi:nitrate reductase NapA
VEGRETKWRYNTAHDPAASITRGEFDFYGHDDHRAWIWLRPHEPPPESPDRGYPFWLTFGPVLEQWGAGSMTQRIGVLHRALPHSYVEMNREDARDLGVGDRDQIRLSSRRGSIEAEVRVEYRCQPPRGVVFVPSFDETLPINRLTLDAQCPLSGQVGGGACAVRVERLTRGREP